MAAENARGRDGVRHSSRMSRCGTAVQAMMSGMMRSSISWISSFSCSLRLFSRASSSWSQSGSADRAADLARRAADARPSAHRASAADRRRSSAATLLDVSRTRHRPTGRDEPRRQPVGRTSRSETNVRFVIYSQTLSVALKERNGTDGQGNVEELASQARCALTRRSTKKSTGPPRR